VGEDGRLGFGDGLCLTGVLRPQAVDLNRDGPTSLQSFSARRSP